MSEEGLSEEIELVKLQRTLVSSCISEVAPALQALKVGLLQDAVYLQVGLPICREGRF